MPAMRSKWFGVVLVAAVVAAGCSSDDGEGADDTAAGPVTTAEAAPVTSAPATTVPATTAPAPTTAPPTTAPATTAPPTTAAPAPLEVTGRGEFAVGVTTITIDDPAGVRPLQVDVWFPLDAAAEPNTLSPQQYTLLPGVYYESPEAFAATAPQAAAGSFPLVVYSHGSGGLRYIHSAYTEALASHGYLVVAPDHTGNTAVDRLAGADAPQAETAFNRPNDVRRVIDAFVDPAHPAAGPYAANVDAERVAVTGHSFGGFTSIAMVTGFANEVGEVTPDDRVDAIVPLAPAVGPTLLTDELLATVDVPMMVVVGTDDVTTPVDPNVTRLWDLAPGTPAYRVELVAGEHQTFTDICAYQEALPALDNVPPIVIDTIDTFAVEGCSEGDMDDVRANDLTITYVLQFLDEVFAGGAPITAAAPDDVIFQSR
jgi:predicted dienelactone hydrolase